MKTLWMNYPIITHHPPVFIAILPASLPKTATESIPRTISALFAVHHVVCKRRGIYRAFTKTSNVSIPTSAAPGLLTLSIAGDAQAFHRQKSPRSSRPPVVRRRLCLVPPALTRHHPLTVRVRGMDGVLRIPLRKHCPKTPFPAKYHLIIDHRVLSPSTISTC